MTSYESVCNFCVIEHFTVKLMWKWNVVQSDHLHVQHVQYSEPYLLHAPLGVISLWLAQISPTIASSECHNVPWSCIMMTLGLQPSLNVLCEVDSYFMLKDWKHGCTLQQFYTPIVLPLWKAVRGWQFVNHQGLILGFVVINQNVFVWLCHLTKRPFHDSFNTWFGSDNMTMKYKSNLALFTIITWRIDQRGGILFLWGAFSVFIWGIHQR